MNPTPNNLDAQLHSWLLYHDRRRELRAAARRFRAAYLAGRIQVQGNISPYLVYLLKYVIQAHVLARLSYCDERGQVQRQRLVEVYALDAPYFWVWELKGSEGNEGRLKRIPGWRAIHLRPLVFQPFRPRPEVLTRVSQLRGLEAKRRVRRLIRVMEPPR